MEQEKKIKAIEQLKNDLSNLLDQAYQLEADMGLEKDSDKISSVITKLTDAQCILTH